jgi:hypothetical protein
MDWVASLALATTEVGKMIEANKKTRTRLNFRQSFFDKNETSA